MLEVLTGNGSSIQMHPLLSFPVCAEEILEHDIYVININFRRKNFFRERIPSFQFKNPTAQLGGRRVRQSGSSGFSSSVETRTVPAKASFSNYRIVCNSWLSLGLVSIVLRVWTSVEWSVLSYSEGCARDSGELVGWMGYNFALSLVVSLCK